MVLLSGGVEEGLAAGFNQVWRLRRSGGLKVAGVLPDGLTPGDEVALTLRPSAVNEFACVVV
jgi:hypothetical protein